MLLPLYTLTSPWECIVCDMRQLTFGGQVAKIAQYPGKYRLIRPYSSLLPIHFRLPPHRDFVSSLYQDHLYPCDFVSQVTLTQQHPIPFPQACRNPKHSTNAPLNHNHPDSIVSAKFRFSAFLLLATVLTLMTILKMRQRDWEYRHLSNLLRDYE